jgi:hypothetical protein
MHMHVTQYISNATINQKVREVVKGGEKILQHSDGSVTEDSDQHDIYDWQRQGPPAMAIAASFILRSINSIEELQG